MVMSITIEAFGEVELQRTLVRIEKCVEDPRPAFNTIHDQFLILEEEQFEGQGKFSGGWAPLADSTVAAKAMLGLDPRILFATEDLFKSLTDKSSEDHVYRATTSQMFTG